MDSKRAIEALRDLGKYCNDAIYRPENLPKEIHAWEVRELACLFAVDTIKDSIKAEDTKVNGYMNLETYNAALLIDSDEYRLEEIQDIINETPSVYDACQKMMNRWQEWCEETQCFDFAFSWTDNTEIDWHDIYRIELEFMKENAEEEDDKS